MPPLPEAHHNVLVMGWSGSGKSTLLNQLSGCPLFLGRKDRWPGASSKKDQPEDLLNYENLFDVHRQEFQGECVEEWSAKQCSEQVRGGLMNTPQPYPRSLQSWSKKFPKKSTNRSSKIRTRKGKSFHPRKGRCFDLKVSLSGPAVGLCCYSDNYC
mmetsp:Transcript_1388/g.1457  ORF Transcript_1388/g.1457 Transcript_1388/m.1457 type:complete len:156 (-) Transcript_1388:537-1004(-)